jgi:hypothetical protein
VHENNDVGLVRRQPVGQRFSLDRADAEDWQRPVRTEVPVTPSSGQHPSA